MMISSNKGIYQLSLSTLKMMNLSDVHSPSWGVSFDYGREQFYWAGGDKGTTIHRSNLKSSNLKTAQEFLAGGPPVTGLAYDWIADNIYYANELEVGVCASSGGNCTKLIEDTRQPPVQVALDPRLGYNISSEVLDVK